MNTFIELSNTQAAELEIEFNNNNNKIIKEYTHNWFSLINIIYKWSLNLINMSISNTYYITEDQYNWIKSNINNLDNNNKIYKLYLLEKYYNLDILTMLGETIHCQIEPQKTIFDLKINIYNQTSIWVYLIELFIKGTENKLNNNKYIFENEITNNSNLFMVINLKAEIKLNKFECNKIKNYLLQLNNSSVSWIKLHDKIILCSFLNNDLETLEFSVTREQFEWLYLKKELINNFNKNKIIDNDIEFTIFSN